ncbi:hypothetical protein Cst_c19230 [Thermoclostridium stercorarium subsp. stercorarium DSM 8532]|uniref:Uncharacterized protein n=1 Tax=Thermoclostridium stercorarium (strain ATCC 35414 / DSM 8532 / NCIMB 11754) TaxID=1121335 RepID=L7VL59_THES1|nr:hypothetical protein Cst_c19230 [Thermoclostridium stercorarium subsp. stercorarium DSM 8532]
MVYPKFIGKSILLLFSSAFRLKFFRRKKSYYVLNATPNAQI